MLVGFQECFLQYIFGVFAILSDVQRETKDFALVAPQQLVECFRITGAGLRYDCGFVIDLNRAAHGGHRKTWGFNSS